MYVLDDGQPGYGRLLAHGFATAAGGRGVVVRRARPPARLVAPEG